MTRLSVIIPGYNTSEVWWRRCLASVKAACGSNDEILCVDDGSKTKPDFLDELAKEDSRIRPIYLSVNSGQSAARNAALKIAQGEWISFVDSDDELVPSIYEKCFERCKTEQCDIVLFGVRVIWQGESLYKDDIPPCLPSRVLNIADLRALYDACLFEYTCNRLFRKEFLDCHSIRFDEGICPGEDTIFNLKCLLADAKYAFEPSVGYVYYRYFSSSLARYQAKYSVSLRLRNDLWRQAKRHCGGTEGTSPKLGELTERELFSWNIQNDWRCDTPLPFGKRWQVLRSHRELLPNSPFVVLLKQIVSHFARKYLYFRCIRRWKIKKLFPQARDLT